MKSVHLLLLIDLYSLVPALLLVEDELDAALRASANGLDNFKSFCESLSVFELTLVPVDLEVPLTAPIGA